MVNNEFDFLNEFDEQESQCKRSLKVLKNNLNSTKISLTPANISMRNKVINEDIFENPLPSLFSLKKSLKNLESNIDNVGNVCFQKDKIIPKKDIINISISNEGCSDSLDRLDTSINISKLIIEKIPLSEDEEIYIWNKDLSNLENNILPVLNREINNVSKSCYKNPTIKNGIDRIQYDNIRNVEKSLGLDNIDLKLFIQSENYRNDIIEGLENKSKRTKYIDKNTLRKIIQNKIEREISPKKFDLLLQE